MSIPISLTLIITSGIVLIIAFDSLKSFLLKREQIKADTILKAEEIRAKNQLEIEKLIRQDQKYNTRADSRLDESEDTRTVREKQQL